MLDFFASPPLEYIPAEIRKENLKLLERLALRNRARESLVRADRNPECHGVAETKGWQW